MRHFIDRDWTAPVNRGEADIAVLRATVKGSGPAMALVQSWYQSLSQDSNGVRGQGGWAVYPVRADDASLEISVDLVSGGEDVADSLQDAADSLYNALTATTATIRWDKIEP